jgi:uncharacterized protein YukE
MTFMDPEVLFGRLTSGDSGGVDAVGAALADVRPEVRDAARGISDGAGAAVSGWRGSAAVEFVTAAQDTTTTATAADRRLRVAVVAIRRAARAYEELQGAAETAIKPWRSAADPQRWVLAFLVIGDLLRASDTYESALTRAASLFDESINLDHVGRGQPWVPQGLAYLEGRDELLVSSYDPSSEDPSSRLTVVDNQTGDELKHVDLGGQLYEGPVGQVGVGDAPNHVGGVEAHGDNVWVTSTVGEPPDQTSQIYRYSQQDIDNARPGETVHPKEVIDTDASSYVTYADGKLWVGQYRTDPDEEPKLYGYDVAGDGSVDTENPEVHSTPTNVQGAVVRDGEFVFAQSGGTDASTLITQQRDPRFDPSEPFEWLSFREEYDLGESRHGVEEIEEVGGDIVILHESNADKYLEQEDEEGIGDDEEHEAHHGNDITRLSLEELGLTPDGAGDGYTTDPDSLRRAAGPLDDSAATLRHAAGAVSRLQLVSHLLGQVPAAETFSTAATRYIAESGQRLDDSATAVHELSESLVASAETYQRLEDVTSSVFRSR